MKTKTTTLFTDVYRKGALSALLLHMLFAFLSTIESYGQVKISAMPETKEDPAGGWIPVVLSNKNYKYNPGSYVQQRTIENIRGLSPTNLPADYVYYVTDLGKEGFFRYDASDVDKPNDNPATKASVDDGATVLVTKNNLRFKRIIENNTVNAKWFEMGNDPSALINTLKYRNNAVITYEQAKAIFDKPNSRVTLQDTDFTTQNCTWFALQRAINFCLALGNKLYIPAGKYTVSKGLLVADMGNFVSGFEIQGAATTYNGSDSQTVLSFTDKNSFGLGFQRVKGLRVRNLLLRGQNAIAGTLYDYFENPDMDWLHGCRNDIFSPHAGFVVDPLFNVGNAAAENMYPGFEAFYTDQGGGSTDVIFDNCRVEKFVVGYCFSPHNAPQNGDNLAINNSWVNYCKSGISVGQSQNRSVAVNNLKCWGGVETLFDSKNYGDGTSDFVEVDQLQIAGGVKFLARSGGWINKGLQIRRMHAELLYSLGSVNTTSHQLGLMIDDSWIDLVGSLPGESVHPARCAFSGSGLKITNSFFGQYQGANALPITISTPYAVFEKCSFYENVVGLMPSNVGELDLWQGFTDFRDYKGARFRSHNAPELISGGFSDYDILIEGSYLEIDRYYMNSYAYRRYSALLVDSNTQPYFQNFFTFKLSQNIQLSSTNTSAQEASFTVTPTSDDYKILRVGDPLYSKDNFPNETGEISTFLLGRVKSKNDATGSVTIEGAAKGIDLVTSYPITIRRYKYVMGSFILGNIIAGTNTVMNCMGEGGVLKGFNGYTVQSPYFPKGTYMISTDPATKTITLSNNALATVNGAEIIGANWNAVEYGTYPDTWPHVCCYQAYKKGDVIYNTDLTNYPDVEKWVCTKSGLTGSVFVPEFNTTTMDVSSKFTGNTTIINGQIAVSKGRFISNIVVSTDKAISSIRIGTTPGGSDVLAGGSTTSVAANTSKVIAINKYYNRRPSGPSGPDGTTTMTLYVQFTQSSATTATINLLISK
jgi:hypothetical protein